MVQTLGDGQFGDADLREELQSLRVELESLRESEHRYRRAAEALAQKCALVQLRAERERARLIDEHDAFIVTLTEDHDRLIRSLAAERDEARSMASLAVVTRDDVAAASKKIARERTRARMELGELALERDVARRDAARASRQLRDARQELARLRSELDDVGQLRDAMEQRRPSLIPMPPGKTRSSAPPPPNDDDDDDALAHALVRPDPHPDVW